MRALVDDGWSPSTAAAAVTAGTAPTTRADTGAPSASPAAGSAGPSPFTERFVDAAAELDAAGVERVLDEMWATATFEEMAERHLLPALVALGEAWASGRLDVAAEHAASHAVQRRLAAAFQAAGPPPARGGGLVLVGLPPGAQHELGALVFSVAARRAGLPILYLGPELPAADWVATATRTAARAAVVGAPTSGDARSAAAVAARLVAARPDLIVAFGGRGAPRRTAGAILLPDRLDESVATLAAALTG